LRKMALQAHKLNQYLFFHATVETMFSCATTED
jgi:hypothetical protein